MTFVYVPLNVPIGEKVTCNCNFSLLQYICGVLANTIPLRVKVPWEESILLVPDASLDK